MADAYIVEFSVWAILLMAVVLFVFIATLMIICQCLFSQLLRFNRVSSQYHYNEYEEDKKMRTSSAVDSELELRHRFVNNSNTMLSDVAESIVVPVVSNSYQQEMGERKDGWKSQNGFLSTNKNVVEIAYQSTLQDCCATSSSQCDVENVAPCAKTEACSQSTRGTLQECCATSSSRCEMESVALGSASLTKNDVAQTFASKTEVCSQSTRGTFRDNFITASSRCDMENIDMNFQPSVTADSRFFTQPVVIDCCASYVHTQSCAHGDISM